jgi:purine-binding chemotaxis protein CheW
MSQSPSPPNALITAPAVPGRTQITKRLKLILFNLKQPEHSGKLRQLNLGARIESVHKILSQTAIYSSGQTIVGVAHIGDREVTIFDLHRQIFNTELPNAGYIVVLKTTDQELVGIPVSDAPMLVEVTATEIRQLPTRYRLMDILGLASHVVRVDTEVGPQTVFLLDTDRFTLSTLGLK